MTSVQYIPTPCTRQYCHDLRSFLLVKASGVHRLFTLLYMYMFLIVMYLLYKHKGSKAMIITWECILVYTLMIINMNIARDSMLIMVEPHDFLRF